MRAHVCTRTMFMRGGGASGWMWILQGYLLAQTPWLALGLLPSEAGLHTKCVVGRLPPFTLHLIYLVTEPHVYLYYIQNLKPQGVGMSCQLHQRLQQQAYPQKVLTVTTD